MAAIWVYGSKRIVVERGIVEFSSCPELAAIGANMTLAQIKRLKLAGWRKVKTPVSFDGFGRRFGVDGEIERR